MGTEKLEQIRLLEDVSSQMLSHIRLKSNDFHLKTLFGFSLDSKTTKFFSLPSGKVDFIQITPFVYVLKKITPSQVKSSFEFFGNVYLIFPNSASYTLADFDDDSIKVQERKHFTEFDLNEKVLKGFLQLDYEVNKLTKINNKLFLEVKAQAIFKNHFKHYNNFNAFSKNGIGYCIKFNDEIIAIASSFCSFENKIEIQIDTLEAWRRKGLARRVGAALLLEASQRNIEPRWDAATMISEKLGQTLGFRNAKQYQMLFKI